MRTMILALIAGLVMLPAVAQTPDQLQVTTDQLRVAAPGPTTRADNQAWVERTNAGTVGVIADGAIGADLLSVVDDDGDDLRVLPMIGRGAQQNVADLLFLRGIDIAVVQSDVLAYTRMLYPGVDQKAQYIVRLYNQEVHILARGDITGLAALQGKPVNIDRAGSATEMTSLLMFKTLGIAPVWRTDDGYTALAKLRSGEIAAMMLVATRPARLFADLPPGTNLHFLAIPMTKQLGTVYDPGVITAVDYPTLVPADADVATVSVAAIMAVYGWSPGSDRYRKVARFVDRFFDRFSQLQRPPHSVQWMEVDIMSEVPGWQRFPAAAEWVQRHLSTATAFNAFLATMPDLPALKDRLQGQYTAWQQQHAPIATVTIVAKKPASR